jgi:serine/threonine-protein kinase
MGMVLRAHDPELGRTLAIKVLLEEHAADPEMASRFLEEARITSRLQHPGVVPIHDVGRFPDGRPFFTMKLVEGRTLAALLAARTSPAEGLQELLRAFEAVCQAIAYAHSRGVIHRDLKPANVMVGEFGEVQVMDWGVAKVIRPEELRDHAGDTSIKPPFAPSQMDQTLAGAVVGTPAYMAPEQARGEPLDERADVFGLGAILCELLTCQPPYGVVRGSSIFQLTQDRCLNDAQSRLNGCGADAELVTLARACLCESPGGRPANAGVVAGRLAAYRAGVQKRLRQAELERAAAEARSDEARAKAAAERRARRLGLGLTAAVVMVAALVTGAGWWRFAQQEAASERSAALLARSELLGGQAVGLSNDDAALERLREALALAEQAQVAAIQADEGSRARASATADRLTGEIRQLEEGRALAERLVEVRLKKEDDFNKSSADEAYRKAFLAHGLDLDQATLPSLASALRSYRPEVLVTAVAALDDLARDRRSAGKPDDMWHRPLKLAALVDQDPWRNRLRGLVLSRPPGGVLGLATLASPYAPAQGAMLTLAGLEAVARRLQLQALAAEAASHGPTSAQMLAAHLREEGMLESAIAVLRDAQHRHPGDVWLNYDLAVLLERTSPLEALRFYTAARAARPEVGHGLAHVLSRLGRVAEAVEMLREMTRLRPSVASHRICLGTALARLGRHDEARAEYEEARRLAPEMYQSHLGLGRLALARKAPREAIPLLERAVALTSDDPSPWNALGHAWQDLKQWRKAEESYRKALSLSSREIDSRFQLARVLESQGLRSAAIAEYRTILAFAPDAHEARANMGSALTETGRPAEGLLHLKKAAEGKPGDATIRKLYGQALARQGQRDEAITELRASLALDPGNAPVCNGLGGLLMEAGQPAEARGWFEKAVALDRNEPSFVYNLGNALSGLGQHAEAVACYDRALALDPTYAEALCNRGHSLRRLGRFAESAESLRLGHAEGKKRKSWPYPSAAWVEWAERLAFAEKRLPEIVSGGVASREERMAAADVCLTRGDHLSRARLIQLAHAEARPIASRPQAALAALAAASDPRLTPEASARWRGQAHAWLAAEARYLQRMAQQGDPSARAALSNLAESPVFRGVRAALEADSLPPHERKAWAALWRLITG